MGETVPDKNIEINGQMVGANTTLKLSIKTAFWIITVIVGLVMGILSYSYFDLKKDVEAADKAAAIEQKEFMENVNGKLDKLGESFHSIDKSVFGIQKDIDKILEKQTRDNPVRRTNVSAEPTEPPSE